MDIKVYVRYDLNKEHEFTVASGTSSGAVFDKELYTLSVTGSGNHFASFDGAITSDGVFVITYENNRFILTKM